MKKASNDKAFPGRGFERRRAGGFTLVEILVVVALTGIVTAAVYKALSAQQKVYSVQDQVVEMQDTLRSAMDVMVREVRMAGCDPSGKAKAGFAAASQRKMRFSMDVPTDIGFGGGQDLNLNGIKDEIIDRVAGNTTSSADADVTYQLFTDPDPLIGKCLTRTTQGAEPLTCKDDDPANPNPDVIARDIEDVDFFYTLADGTSVAVPGDRTQIRRVEITILAKNPKADKDFVNTQAYTFPSSATFPAANDHYRRRMQRTVVLCRNMGLAK